MSKKDKEKEIEVTSTKSEIPIQSAAAAMRMVLNADAKAAHAKLKGKDLAAAGPYKDLAMNPAEADELASIKEFVELKPYFKVATGVPGWPCGGFCQLIGKSDSGKTSMMIESMVSCQKANGIVFFLDSENKFPWDRFENNGGITEDVVAIPVNSLEAAWDAWWKILHKVKTIREEGMLIVDVPTGEVDDNGKPKTQEIKIPIDRDIKIFAGWDSIPGSIADKILEEDSAGNSHVAVEARINNKEIRKIKKMVKQYRVAVVAVNHSYMTQSIGMYAPPPEEIVKGGEELYFMSSLIIKLVKGAVLDREVTVNGETFKQKIGRKSRIEIFKGHMSGRTTLVVMNVCAPGLLTDAEFTEYRKSIQGQL